jgi:hypothetical protein
MVPTPSTGELAMKTGLRAFCWILVLSAACGAAWATDPPASSPYFTEVPGAIPDQKPVYDAFQTATEAFVTPLDVNHDGLDDIVIHYWKFARPVGVVTAAPCTNKLVVLVQKADSTFVDKTSTYIVGPADLGACSRKSVVVDVNADGYDDIVFATNQEDGRNTDVLERVEAPVAALVSRPDGRYAVETFGTPSWYHSVGVGYDAMGKPWIAAAGYTQPSEVWQRSSSGTWLDIGSGFPATNANTFLFSASGATTLSDQLIQNAAYPNNFDIGGAWRDGSGIWHDAPDLTLFPYAGTINLVSWNGSTSSTVVVKVGDEYAASGAFFASCRFVMSPGSPGMTILKLSAGMLPGDYTGPDQVVSEDDVIQEQRLFGFTLGSGKLQQANLPIAREQTVLSSNFFDCKDLNGDGYMDIVVYPYDNDGYPLVYMNTRYGTLRYIGQAAYPYRESDWDMSGTSLLHDFDKDGIPDLLSWPGNGRSTEYDGDVGYYYYKGTAVLPISWQADRDFNADATSDVLWHNVRTGANTIWRSSQGTPRQAVDGISDLDWQIVGVGDFDGDGHDDLLWRHARTGKNAWWPAAKHAATKAITAVTDPAWKVVGVGDFDGDGEDDIFWRNDKTGSNSIWRSASSATKQTTPGVTDTAWQVAGIGDFDGDGQDDVLWRDVKTGANTIWRSGRRATKLAVAKVSVAWNVAGVADFDDDGNDDILWHNPSTGANSIWRSAGSATKQAVATMADLDWQVADTGDYNGDGKADILWRNGHTGANVIWRSALSTTTQSAKAVSDLNWTVVR